jgi:hypothetical protein
MIEDLPFPTSPPATQEGDHHRTDTGSSKGALTLAALATTIVAAIWFAFYFLVFVPRAPAP